MTTIDQRRAASHEAERDKRTRDLTAEAFRISRLAFGTRSERIQAATTFEELKDVLAELFDD